MQQSETNSKCLFEDGLLSAGVHKYFPVEGGLGIGNPPLVNMLLKWQMIPNLADAVFCHDDLKRVTAK